MVDAPMIPFRRIMPPFGNYAVMLLTACAFAVQMLLDPDAHYLRGLVLERWSLPGLLGHMWLHLTSIHLVGNLLTLWIFGHYVCSKLGNVTYAITYVGAGVVAGLAHIACDGRPVIGASGAIMGVLGMYVILCFRQFGPLGPWLILVWFLVTLGAGLTGGFPAAYMSHVGGFLGGIALAVGLVALRRVDVEASDPEFVTLLGSVLM